MRPGQAAQKHPVRSSGPINQPGAGEWNTQTNTQPDANWTEDKNETKHENENDFSKRRDEQQPKNLD